MTDVVAQRYSSAVVSGQSSTQLPVEVKYADMPADMQKAAMEIGRYAVLSLSTETEMASYIKKQFDSKFEGKWHCIIGRAYGSYVTHDTQKFIYFQVGNEVILLFKST
eukprot:Lankesteria_metandrocarpae@DN6127_c0_g1_i1.p1